MKNSLDIDKQAFSDYVSEWEKENLNKEIFIVDIETTGLDPRADMICEVGICRLNLATGTTTPVVNIVTKEEHKYFFRDAWVFRNSTLTFKEVKGAIFFKYLKPMLNALLNNGYEVGAYNCSFDFGFLKERGIRVKKRFPDVMYLLKDIMQIPHWKYGVKFPSVQEAWDYLFPDNDYAEKHRALDDAMHEAKIYHECYKRGWFNGE